MSSGNFARGTMITLSSNALSLLIGLGLSVILARALGPEGRGIYALVTLLPSFIVTFANLGIGPATSYFTARGQFRRQEILGVAALLSLGTGCLGLLAGIVVVLFFREIIFPNVAAGFLLLSLPLVLLEMFFINIQQVLLGAQRITEFNFVQIINSVLMLALVALALQILKAGVAGAILAVVFAYIGAAALVFRVAERVAGGVDFRLNPSYTRRAISYGIQAHLSNILGFLNYRVDMFMVNWFLGPAAVGFYAVSVGLVEKLWTLSQASATVLFPRVAAETDDARLNEFTALVARIVLYVTAFGALILAILSKWIVLLLFSEAFLPAVDALQVLLVGVITLSAGRVLANHIAARGYPAMNVYTSLAAVASNVVLNLLWIPQYGIVGAAWASTVSYTVVFIGSIFFYCRLSGNRWTAVVFPQQTDWTLYQKTGKAIFHWALTKIRI